MSWVCPRAICGNRGDLLSRWGILTELGRLAGPEPLEVATEFPEDLPPEARCRVVPCGRLYNLVPAAEGWRSLRRGSVVWWAGGLDLQDDSSRAKLVHLLALFSLYRLLGLRIVAVMQGAGPLETATGRWLARRVLDRVHCFIARDPGTHRLLEDLGYRGHMLAGCDGIFLGGFPGRPPAEGEDDTVQRLIPRRSSRPVIGLNLRLWFHFSSSWIPYQFARRRYDRQAAAGMERLRRAGVALIKELRRRFDARVLLLSMYQPGREAWEDDLPWLAAVERELGDDDEVVVVDEELSLPAFYTLISHLDLMIGMRLHSTLTALRAGVPAVHLSYTLKGGDIYRDLGLERYAVDLERFIAEPETAADLAEELLAAPEARRDVAERTAAAIERNREALARAVELLRRPPESTDG